MTISPFPATREDAKRALYHELEPLLIDPKLSADGRLMSFCPCHPDGTKHGNRSLSLHPRIGLNCFAGCKFEDILKALRGNTPRPAQDQKNGRQAAVYQYNDESGTLIAEKRRVEYPDGRKQFQWRLPKGEWKDGLGTLRLKDMPLYGAELVKEATGPVWFVEGEKAQRAMTLQGFTAVTHGGGASTKDFGTSLDGLRGRTVILWADNDAVGREYMTTVMARLKGLAAEASFFSCPVALPDKGDAYDYFEMGGKPEALLDAVAPATGPIEPTVQMMADDAVRVTLPGPGGPLVFDFKAIETSGRRFDAELTIDFGPATDQYNERVNLFSSTARTELRRELDTLYGKEYEWAKVLNKTFGLTRSFYMGLDRSIDVADAPLQLHADRFALDPLLPKDAVTIFFGDGGASKTMLMCALAFHFSTGIPFLGMQTPGLPVLYVDWEDTPETFARRIRRLGGTPDMALGRNMIFYWPARGVPLAQQADAIRAKVVKDGIALVIYDSVALACGGPPEDAMSASSFVNAAKRVGVTSPCVAHVTKAGEEEKPFGSVFWHNAARRTWLVKKQGDDDGDATVTDLGLICRKVNDGTKPKAIPVKIEFQDPDGMIEAKPGRFDVSTPLAKAAMSPRARLEAALRLDRSSQKDFETLMRLVGAESEKERDTLRRTLNRGVEHPTHYFARFGDKFSLGRQDEQS